MGCSPLPRQSPTPPQRQSPTPPPVPKYWRNYPLDLKIKDWNAQTVKSLHDNVVKLTGIKGEGDISFSVPRLKIIFVGHVGAGKSSLINSFIAALKGFISNVAVEGGRDHTTTSFREYPAYSEDGKELDIAFYDVRGTGAASAGSREVDVLRAILMKKKIGEKFDPGVKYTDALDEENFTDEHAAHVILYVTDGAALEGKIKQGEDDPWFHVMMDLKDTTDKWGISRYLVATHMDIVDSKLKDNIKAMHTSENVNMVVEEIREKTKFPKKNILPVLNPVETTYRMEDEYRTYFLYLLLQIVQDAQSALKQRIHEQRRIQQQQQLEQLEKDQS